VQLVEYNDGLDNYPAFRVAGSGEFWLIDPFAQDAIADTFDYFPAMGGYAVLRGPQLGDAGEGGPPFLFGVYRFMEIENCDPNPHFSAEPSQIQVGQCATLRWNSDFGDLSLDGQSVENSGEKQVCLTGTTTFALRNNLPWGTYERSVTVEVLVPDAPAGTEVAAGAISDGAPATAQSDLGIAASGHAPDAAATSVAVISKPQANLRKGPGTNYGIVGVAAQGERFEILERVNDWNRVCCYQGAEVWVSNVVINITEASGAASSGQSTGAAKVASDQVCGYAAIFLAPDQAVWLGHVGFGIWDMVDTRTFWGSVDGVSDERLECRPFSELCGSPNRVWVSVSNDFLWRPVFNEMGAHGYTKVKYIALKGDSCDFVGARSKANAQYDQEYSVVGRNCADAAVDVLNAFGVHLPSLQEHPIPREFYGQLKQDPVTGEYWMEEPLAGAVVPAATPTPSGDTPPVPVPGATPAQPRPTVTPPTTPQQLVWDFERVGNWQLGDQPYGSLTQSVEQVHGDRASGKISYSFPPVNDNFVVFRQLRTIVGEPKELNAWGYGDGSAHFLNVWVQDARGVMWQFSFGRVSHTGWAQMTAPIDAHAGWPSGKVAGGGGASDVTYPIKFFAFVVDGVPDGQASTGAIYIDDVYAQ
jgi:uncharacterized protein YraI